MRRSYSGCAAEYFGERRGIRGVSDHQAITFTGLTHVLPCSMSHASPFSHGEDALHERTELTNMACALHAVKVITRSERHPKNNRRGYDPRFGSSMREESFACVPIKF